MECLRCDKEVSPGKALCPACLQKQPNLQADTKVIQTSILNNKKTKERILELEHAGFWLRTIALIIDLSFLVVIQNLIWKALFAKWDNAVFKYFLSQFSILNPSMIEPKAILGTLCFFTLPTVLYYWILESSRLQGTLGKTVLGLKVSDLNGMRLSFLKSLVRSTSRLLCLIPFIGTALFLLSSKYIDPNIAFLSLVASLIFVPLNFLIAGFTAQKQALHDKMASTLVNKGSGFGRKRTIIGILVVMWILIASFLFAYQNPNAKIAFNEVSFIFNTSVVTSLKYWISRI